MSTPTTTIKPPHELTLADLNTMNQAELDAIPHDDKMRLAADALAPALARAIEIVVEMRERREWEQVDREQAEQKEAA